MYDGEDKYLPYSIMKKMGIKNYNPVFVLDEEDNKILNKVNPYNIYAIGYKTSLSYLNDTGLSFKEIAKIIRKHYKEI